MRLIDADVVREQLQDYLTTTKYNAEQRGISTEIISVIEIALSGAISIVDMTPTKYIQGKGY